MEETNTWASYSEKIHYQQIEWELGNLVGRVLTIIDSSITDSIQRKAMKDLVKSAFGDTFFEFQKQAENEDEDEEDEDELDYHLFMVRSQRMWKAFQSFWPFFLEYGV